MKWTRHISIIISRSQRAPVSIFLLMLKYFILYTYKLVAYFCWIYVWNQEHLFRWSSVLIWKQIQNSLCRNLYTPVLSGMFLQLWNNKIYLRGRERETVISFRYRYSQQRLFDVYSTLDSLSPLPLLPHSTNTCTGKNHKYGDIMFI